MGIVPEMSVSFGFASSKKLCGKVLILSFSARDGCIGRKPRGEKNDEMHNSQRLFIIFSPFFTRFGRERPAKKPRRAVFSLVFALEIVGETAVFAKDLQKVPILRGKRTTGKGKVGKRVFFAGFPFGLSPAVCTRVRQARSAGCAASRTMKGSWAKSRHVSRNSCALFLRSRAVLSPQTQQPHPRRQGEGGVWGEVAAAALLGSGAQRKERGGSPRREGDTARWERDVPSQWSRGAVAPRKRGEQKVRGTRSALVRATRRDQKRGPPPPGCPPLPPGCTGRKLLPGRSPRGWPSGGSGSLAPPKRLRR